MRENVRDRSECHHDESERRGGGVQAVGPINDEPHALIESLVADIVHAEAKRGEYSRLALALANGLGRDDERFEPAALCPRAEPVEHHGDLVLVEVAGKACPKSLVERVGTSEITPSTFQLAQGDGLVVGQVGRVFEQCTAAPRNRRAVSWSGS